jgi:hypothetical protein
MADGTQAPKFYVEQKVKVITNNLQPVLEQRTGYIKPFTVIGVTDKHVLTANSYDTSILVWDYLTGLSLQNSEHGHNCKIVPLLKQEVEQIILKQRMSHLIEQLRFLELQPKHLEELEALQTKWRNELVQKEIKDYRKELKT